ncbi:uncharacterized protein LOC142979368 isoform X2 [Anticarsia gemmatalis]|uniref:uncharacterized protein LOC142979368 isoform X2 n=1 Tax=Anticarsia gemmatalis TaxID=129554 RepID=UPI003F7732EA
MVERAGIIIFALWYAAIAFNYYIVPIFEPFSRKYKCKCSMCSEMGGSHTSDGDDTDTDTDDDQATAQMGLPEAIIAAAEIVADEIATRNESAAGDVVEDVADDANFEEATE